MRQRVFYAVYAGFNAVLIVAALIFALHVSAGQWVVEKPGGIHQHQDAGKKQLRRSRD